MKKANYQVVKLRESIKIGSLSLLEIDPNYLELNKASADVYFDDYGIYVEARAEIRESVENYLFFIPYTGVRYIKLAEKN